MMKNRKALFLFFLLNIGMALVWTVSCKKDKSCYDEEFYQKHKNDICPTDCPGVVGCDGKTYCNECEANRNGVRVD